MKRIAFALAALAITGGRTVSGLGGGSDWATTVGLNMQDADRYGLQHRPACDRRPGRLRDS